jgi:hypothetical protein
VKCPFHEQYDQERSLFELVGPRFQERGRLAASDFFLMVRRMANRFSGPRRAVALAERGEGTG